MSASGHEASRNAKSIACRIGGFCVQHGDPEEHKALPSRVRNNQLAATVEGYKAQAIFDGIPDRQAGLFPSNDPFLTLLSQTEGLHPFEKHLSGLESPYELLKKGSWVSGNAAAENGFDLRLFYKAPEPGQKHGTLTAAARLGDRASIGNGYWMSAHGGAIESLLDESTAELAKMEFTPLLSTIEANFKLKKPVPLHTTLQIDCQITSISGLRCWVHGSVRVPDSDVILAVCEAQLADLQPILSAQKLTQL